MHTGRLDRRIEIRRSTTAADSFNAAVETWTTLTTVWAEAKPVSDGERMQAGQMLANKMIRFTIRYSSTVANVDPRDRIRFESREYDISGIKEIGRRVGLEITATARAETP